MYINKLGGDPCKQPVFVCLFFFNRAEFLLFYDKLSKRDAKLRQTGVAKYIRSTSSREFEECLDKAGENTVET